MSLKLWVSRASSSEPSTGIGRRSPVAATRSVGRRSAARPGRSPARATATPASAASTTPIPPTIGSASPSLVEHLLRRLQPLRDHQRLPGPGLHGHHAVRARRRRCAVRTGRLRPARGRRPARRRRAAAPTPRPRPRSRCPLASSRASRMSPAPSTSVGHGRELLRVGELALRGGGGALQQVGVERLQDVRAHGDERRRPRPAPRRAPRPARPAARCGCAARPGRGADPRHRPVGPALARRGRAGRAGRAGAVADHGGVSRRT